MIQETKETKATHTHPHLLKGEVAGCPEVHSLSRKFNEAGPQSYLCFINPSPISVTEEIVVTLSV